VEGRPPLAQYVQENLAIDFRGAHATEEDSLLRNHWALIY
jgi:hypothetical protein